MPGREFQLNVLRMWLEVEIKTFLEPDIFLCVKFGSLMHSRKDFQTKISLFCTTQAVELGCVFETCSFN
jgi:hypothetical protein